MRATKDVPPSNNSPQPPAKRTRRRASGLLLRLGAVGAVQLVMVGLAAWGTLYAARTTGPDLGVRRALLAGWAQEIEVIVDDQLLLNRTLMDLSAREGVDLTIYAGNGRLIATTVSPPLPPPWPRDDAERDSRPYWAVQSYPTGVRLRGGAHLVGRFPPPMPQYFVPLLTMLIGLLAVLAGAWATRRWILRPLEKITAAAHALGSGNLDARSRLKRHDEIGAVGHAFDEMADHVEKLLQTERELLANVSHELRTPLARIRVAIEMAVEGDPKRAQAALADIALDLDELEQLVSDILMAARLDSGGGISFPDNREYVAPRSVVDVAAERFRSRHPQRELRVEYRQRESRSILVNQVLFRRVLDNLLDNAHKYTPDLDAAIMLRLSATETDAVFEVIDEGIGISTEDMAQIFTPFFRADRSRCRGAGGVGLGMTLVHRIVEEHGGTIGIRSKLRQGTTVEVRIPFIDPNASHGDNTLPDLVLSEV